MKRIISILMICLLMLSYVNVCATEEENQKAIRSLHILQTLGLISVEYDSEVLDLTLGVTRAELASLTESVFNFMGYNTNELYYHDVPADFWAYSSIGYLVHTGALTVPEEKMFYPERVATEAEAYKIMICLLGLESTISERGSWPNNVYAAASDMKLTENIVNDNRLTYAELFKILHNAVLIELPEITSFSESGSFTLEYGNETYLEKNYNIYAARGIVEAVEEVTTYNGTGREGIIVISGAEYEINGFSCKEHLGTYVEYYYKNDSKTDTNTLLYIESRDKSTVISLNDFDNSISYNPSTRTLSYYENGTRQRNVKISESVNIVYNDRFLTSDHNAVLSAHINSMRLIDTEGGNNYNLLYIEAYDNYVFSAFDIQNEIIYALNGERTISLKEFENYVILDSIGEALEISELSAGNIISIYETKCKDLIKIICSDSTVSGAIQGYSEDDGYTKVTVDGNDYMTEYEYSGEVLRLASTATLFLDHLGFVVDIDYGVGNKVGLLIRYAHDDSSFSEKALFKIYTTKGDFITPVSDEKITIDGTRAKTYDAIDNLLGGNSKQEQLVIYELNQDGEVKSLDTIRLNASGKNGIERITSDKSLRNDPSKSALISRRAFSPKVFPTTSGELPVIVDGSTIVISVPGSFGTAYTQEKKDFTIKSGSNLGWDKYYTSECYRIGESDGTVDVMLIYGRNWRSDRVYMLVDKFSRTWNEDDCVVVDVLEGYGTDGAVKYTINPGETVTVQKGDFIELTGIGNGDYYTITDSFSPADAMPEFKSQEINSDVVVAGYVCANKNGKIYVSADKASGSAEDYDDVFNLSSVALHIYDKQTGEITPNVSHNEIRALDSAGVADAIVIYCQQMNAKAAVIYR